MTRIGKSGILFLLYLLLSLLLGCAPYQTYDELEAEAKVTGDNSKLEKRDALAEVANEYFANKRRCMQAQGLAWVCTSVYGAANPDPRREKPVKDIDDLLKRYRRERGNGCGCATNRAAGEMLERL